ncbi:uncharacterized protein LOC141804417 [Halichoeres trimaculatus]|uniref:uncharacterized protein LOC141804417 n=1 Tax=Halichoeres trimaculatus TaxID=147232 RepID=UPI003D9E3DB2
MSWRGTSPQEVMLQKSEVLQKKDQQLLSHDAEVEKDKSEPRSPLEDGPVVADDDDDKGDLSPKDTETLFKIIKLPLTLQDLLSESIRDNEPSASVKQPSREDLLQSFNQPQRLLHNQTDGETNPQADTSETTAYQMYVDSFHMKRKLNESIWSVESLAPFVPNKESLQQSSIFEPKAIAELSEQDENDGPGMLTDNSVVKPSKERRRSLRFSSSDSLLMSDNLIVFSTPAVEQSRSQKQTMDNESGVCDRRESLKDQTSTPSEKTALASPPQLQRRIILSPPTREEADKPRSSEPEAPQSPNQETFTLREQKEKSPRSSEQEETLLMNSAEEEDMSPPCQLIHGDVGDRKSDDGSGENAEVRDVQLSVPGVHQTTAVSPSRGNLVDCGVQCGVMEEQQCMCEKSSYGPNKRNLFKYSDARFSNCRAEGFCANGQNPKNQKRNGPWKHRGPEKQNGQTDGYNGYPGKPGRSRGGNGRNHRS